MQNKFLYTVGKKVREDLGTQTAVPVARDSDRTYQRRRNAGSDVCSTVYVTTSVDGPFGLRIPLG